MVSARRSYSEQYKRERGTDTMMIVQSKRVASSSHDSFSVGENCVIIEVLSISHG